MDDNESSAAATIEAFPHGDYCPNFQRTIELIGRRWTASILRALFAGKERFTDIAQTVPGLSHRLLTERLEELKEADLITIEPGTKHGTYRLTERGRDLLGVFQELEDWNARWYETSGVDTAKLAP
ncbi:MAG: helix-turn-helix transcriptional regulator [Actinomycetia bacterium]|nr:helix-turn-helix transcriptional regulator [Actinomycetes bacterium]